MISLWILAIITILAVSIGHRVSLALRLSSYQQDRIKAYCLSRAGIQRAIAELEKDNQNQYDSLSEPWSTGIDPATNQLMFANIEIEEGSGEAFTVGYRDNDDKYICMVDEESKININTASEKLLVTLLTELNMEEEDAKSLPNYIRIWRGDSDSSIPPERVYEYFKKKPFIVPEELILVLESFYQSKEEESYQQKAQETFGALKYLITVCPNTKININTASEAVLTIFARSVAESDEEKNSVDIFVEKIRTLRNQQPNKCFQSLDAITVEGVGSEYENLLNRLKTNLSVQSNYFKIGSTGNAGKVAKKINAVYNRQDQDKQIVYWHQN